MYWEYNGMQSDVMGIFIMGRNGHILGSIQWDVMGWNGKWDRVCNRMYNQQNDFWPCPKTWGGILN